MRAGGHTVSSARAVPRAARTGGPLHGAGLAVLLVTAVAACGAGEDPGVRYGPPAELPRLGADTLPVPSAGRVIDFELAGDTLYLLEPGRIARLTRRADGWAEDMSFGREGFGPGELSSATALSLWGEHLVVTHVTRVQRFSRAGAFVDGRDLMPPCMMVRPRAVVTERGTFVHGMCQYAGYATDTMKAVLAWSPDGTAYTTLVEDVAFTRDGTVGSVFGARSAMTPGTAGAHAFGNGTSNCVWRVTDGDAGTAGPPHAQQVCPAVRQRYSAPPPPGVEARLRAGVGGTRMDWPATLPDFVDRLDLGAAGILLVRPFVADSVVLQLAGATDGDVAVLPLDGLLGCKAEGCLWLREDGVVPHAFVLQRQDLLELVRARQTADGASS